MKEIIEFLEGLIIVAALTQGVELYPFERCSFQGGHLVSVVWLP